jgi:hypothetical protein
LQTFFLNLNMRYIILLLVLFPSLSFSQITKAKLIDFSEDKIPAFCGYQKAATTLKFVLTANFRSLKKGQNILVVITCPREFGINNYGNDRVYSLTLFESKKEQKKIGDGWQIFYKYENEKLPRFWCKEIKLCK